MQTIVVLLGLSILLLGGSAWFYLGSFRRTGRSLARTILGSSEVAEPRSAEKALPLSEERYRQITEHMRDLVCQADADGLYRYISPSYRQLLGYEAEDLLGEPVFARIHPDDVALVLEGYHAGVISGQPQIVEFRYRHAEGHYLWLQSAGNFIHDSNGNLLGTVISSCDITERKRVEEALQESEQRLHTLAAATFEGIALSEDGIFLDLNDQLAGMLGYDRQELIGREIMQVVAPETRERVGQVIHSGNLEPYEHIALRKDKTVFPAEVRARNMTIAGRKIRVSVIRDITERKQSETALRESHEQLEATLNALPDLLFEVDGQGYIHDFRAPHPGLLYVPPDQFLGETLHEILPQEPAEAIDSAIQQALAEGHHHGGTYSLKTPSGLGWFELSIATKGDPAKSDPRLIVLVRDITERKRSEEALLASTQRFRGLIENSADAITLLSFKREILFASPSIARILGYPLDELIGCKADEFIHPEDLASAARVVEESLRKPAVTVEFNSRIRHQDGSWRYMEGVLTNLLDERGVNAIVANYRDVSERKEAEAEHRKLEEQMRHVQKLESLGVLAGGIAHDFNNLLMAILGNADLALLKLPASTPARHNIQEISRASRRAAELCRQMLAYSGKGKFIVQRLNLSEIVQEMAHILEVSLSKTATLRYQFSPDLPGVEADATQLSQIIMNLITNAADALDDKNGVITISTGVVECDRGYLRGNYLAEDLPEGRYVYLEVADTGYGMDEETRQRIFDPFYSTKFTGRGLGLAAVLGIVRGHNGSIRVSSELGRGSTFRVLLPAIAGSTQALEQDRRETQPKQKGAGLILLIDDEEVVRTVGREMLEQFGFEVLTAADGDEGIKLCRTHLDALVCVLLDLTMPVLSGEETFRQLRQICQDIPIVLSSGYDEQEVTNRFAGETLAGFVHKPYTVSRLQETLGGFMK